MKLTHSIQHRTLFDGKRIEWTAYTEDEAPADLVYCYWKDYDYSEANCRGKVFHVLSDDGLIVPVYHVAYVRAGVVLQSAFGEFIIPRRNKAKAKMLVMAESKGHLEDYFSYQKHARPATQSIVAQLASHGLDINEILAILTIHPKGDKSQWIRKFYKSEECAKMIREEVKTILNNCGITEEKVIKMLMEAHEVAKEKRDCSNMLRAAETFVDMYGFKDKTKETTTNTLELGSETEDLQRLENVKERLKLSQKKESETTTV